MTLENRLHRPRRMALALLLVAVNGCAAAQRDAAPAASAAPPVGVSTVAGPQAAASPASPPADASAVAPSAVAPDAESEDRSGAAREFERAARMVDGASSDCRQACRALASMDRACGQLCRLDADSTCEGDKTRLRSARKRGARHLRQLLRRHQRGAGRAHPAAALNGPALPLDPAATLEK